MERGFDLVSGGTDNHLMLVDLRNKRRADRQGRRRRAGPRIITVNKNTVPGEQRSPFVTSGIRIGTAALTTRGMRQAEMRQIGDWIAEVLEDAANEEVARRVSGKVTRAVRGVPAVPAVPARTRRLHERHRPGR